MHGNMKHAETKFEKDVSDRNSHTGDHADAIIIIANMFENLLH